MRRLHRSNHAELLKQRKVRQGNGLRVFYPEPLPIVLAQHFPIRIQRHPVRPVANGVRVYLKALFHRLPRHPLHRLLLQNHQSRVPRIIRIRLPKSRPAGPDRPISHQLNRTHRQPLMHLRPRLQKPVPHRPFAANHRVNPNGQLPRRQQLPIPPQLLLPNPSVVHRRHPQPGALPRRRPQPRQHLIIRSRGNLRSHQPLRPVNQHPRRMPRRIPDNLPAHRVRRLIVDPRNLHRLPVHPPRMPIHPR